MYFLKRNLLNILIWMLLFAVLAVVFNILVPSHSYSYEEYYEVEGLELEAIANVNIELNDTVNQEHGHKAVEVVQYGDTEYVQLLMHEVQNSEISSIRNDVQRLLLDESVQFTDGQGMAVFFNGGYLTKFIVIAAMSVLGLIVGLALALNRSNLRTEEDIEAYTNEKIIGTF